METICGGVPYLKKSDHEIVIPMDATHVWSNVKTHTLKKCLVCNGKESIIFLKDYGTMTPKV